MRTGVTSKIVAGISAVLVVGFLSMLTIYLGLTSVEDALDRLADWKEPTSAAANEMEINVNGMGLAVLKYLDFGEAEYRAMARDDGADFEKFHRTYLALAQTDRERALAKAVQERYREFKTLGEMLMDEGDVRGRLFGAVATNLEKLDEIIDERIQPGVRRLGAGALEKLEYVLDMEAEIAEVGMWLANYLRVPTAETKTRLFRQREEFDEAFAGFRSLDLTREERRLAEIVAELFGGTMKVLGEGLAIEDGIREKSKRFVELRAEIDRLLDDEIQVLAAAGLATPREDADRATRSVLRAIRFLIPLFVLAALAVALLLIRLIMRPIRELEESEGKLRLAVADLRLEVDERARAEEEQARLQMELRRRETLSAMGALVAGVAHEVRNPLFGISSILDAMEARFEREGIRDEYDRYRNALRAEVDRLNKLMRDLLEYGRPSTADLSAGPITEALAEAVHSCQPMAAEARVEIRVRAQDRLPSVHRSPTGLVAAFRNLIENAVQHTPPGGAVSVVVEEVLRDGRRWIECIVSDGGPGFAADDIPRLFEPFFTRRRGGTGLGLSIAQRIVDDHGGRVSAANRPGGGAEMRVDLPSIEIHPTEDREVRGEAG